jgi:hypothetical protein
VNCPHAITFAAGSTPNELPPKNAARMGDEGKAVGFPKADGFAVLEAALLC